MKYILFLWCALCIASQAIAQKGFSSGTGFFVSRKGELVTNAHVVQPCIDPEKIYYRIGTSRPQLAHIISIDQENDLALLHTGQRPARIASLRWMHTRIQEDHDVFILGYPEATSSTSPYSKAYATIKALNGPQGEVKWLQFTNAARHGNSGGPLLDFGGNVVGVVTAKTSWMEQNAYAPSGRTKHQSDVAVTTETLKRFLDINRVQYRQADSVLQLGQRRLERLASSYITHIYCEANK